MRRDFHHVVMGSVRLRTGRIGPGGVAVCDSSPRRYAARQGLAMAACFPARHARALPAEPPGQPRTVPVYMISSSGHGADANP